MTNYSALEGALVSALGPLRLIAVSYLSAAPRASRNSRAWSRPAARSGISRRRGDGFYTVPGDHLNCPVGSYTHAIDLPAERASELEQTLSLMAGIGYVRMEEVPSIPRLSQTPAFIYYAPLAKAAVAPDVIIAAGRPGPLMRLQEASARAGAASAAPAARPSDVHGAAGGHGPRVGHERGLHRQPRLHRSWRRRAVLDDSRAAAWRMSSESSR